MVAIVKDEELLGYTSSNNQIEQMMANEDTYTTIETNKVDNLTVIDVETPIEYEYVFDEDFLEDVYKYLEQYNGFYIRQLNTINGLSIGYTESSTSNILMNLVDHAAYVETILENPFTNVKTINERYENTETETYLKKIDNVWFEQYDNFQLLACNLQDFNNDKEFYQYLISKYPIEFGTKTKTSDEYITFENTTNAVDSDIQGTTYSRLGTKTISLVFKQDNNTLIPVSMNIGIIFYTEKNGVEQKFESRVTTQFNFIGNMEISEPEDFERVDFDSLSVKPINGSTITVNTFIDSTANGGNVPEKAYGFDVDATTEQNTTVDVSDELEDGTETNGEENWVDSDNNETDENTEVLSENVESFENKDYSEENSEENVDD